MKIGDLSRGDPDGSIGTYFETDGQRALRRQLAEAKDGLLHMRAEIIGVQKALINDLVRPVKTGVRMGRPGALSIYGTMVRELRGEMSQQAFSRLTKLSVDVIQRAEHKNEATMPTIKKLVQFAKRKTARLTAEELQTNQPQKTART